MDENEILLKEIFDINQNVQDALILLKIWLAQKNLGVSIIFIYICLFNNLFKFFQEISRAERECQRMTDWDSAGNRINVL